MSVISQPNGLEEKRTGDGKGERHIMFERSETLNEGKITARQPILTVSLF
jgi:hypothetical protein